MEYRKGPSSRRVTNTKVILFLPGTLMPKGTSLVQKGNDRNASVTQSRLVSVAVCVEVSAWYVLMSAMGAARVGI